MDCYIVRNSLDGAPISDYMMHGYAERQDFYSALRRLVGLWGGRVGECVGERHGFLLLRFHDTPGGAPDEEWLPCYLLEPYTDNAPEDPEADENIRELDEAFGFD